MEPKDLTEDQVCQRHHLGRDVLHQRDELCVRVGVGVGSVEAVDVAQQHQQISFDAAGDDGGEGVIVADGGDLVGGDGIVLVDDGQCAQLQQAGEGVLNVLAAAGVLDVHTGEQNLRHRVVVGAEQPVVGVHQLTLTHGGTSLLGGHIGRAGGKRQLAHTHADGTRRHEDDLMSGVLQIAEHFHQLFGVADVQPSGGVGQCGGADFDYDAHRSTLSHLFCLVVGGDDGVHHRAPQALFFQHPHALDGAAARAAHGVLECAGMLAALKHQLRTAQDHLGGVLLRLGTGHQEAEK